MAYYRQVGHVPGKRHTQHRDPESDLYYEELMGEEGFSSDSALLYHRGTPSAAASSPTFASSARGDSTSSVGLWAAESEARCKSTCGSAASAAALRTLGPVRWRGSAMSDLAARPRPSKRHATRLIWTRNGRGSLR